MSQQLRTDFGMRVGGEKGQLKDEFLTRSQLVPGSSIWFEYMANYDIKIHASVSGGGGGGVFSMHDKMMTGIITLDEFYSGAFNQSSGDLHVAVDDDINGIAGDRRYYGTMKYKDIVHNWGLDPIDAFLIRLQDNRSHFSGTISLDSLPKIVSIDKNTIRIFATETIDNGPNIAIATNTLGSCTTVSADPNITCLDTSDLRVGMWITGTNIPDMAIITSITDTTHFVINQNATGSGSGITITIYLWEANEDTDLIRSPKHAYYPLAPKYRFTLQEYR